MGWIIGKGIGIPFRMGGAGLGSSYWTQLNAIWSESEIAFYTEDGLNFLIQE